MKNLLAIFVLSFGAATTYGQTMKALSYDTNGRIVYSATNNLTFTNAVGFAEGDLQITAAGGLSWVGALRYEPESQTFYSALNFSGTNVSSGTRTNLGLGATWLTNTNVTNFRAAIGLGWSALTNTNAANFRSAISAASATNNEGVADKTYGIWDNPNGEYGLIINDSIVTVSSNSVSSFRTAIGLGATNNATFRNIIADGNIVISNQSTNNNGLFFVYRTNNEAFLGLANLIASNNTTVSNETLLRVGVAEATSRSAQFGFRTVRTNNGGEGFATFSVFGYNALMMIGPSDRSRTNTATNAGIEADIWTITPTNRVATLRDTNSGAFTLHQELGFSTGSITTNAPANTTNVALWLRVWVGTNSYRLPLYQ